jgi:hypothetical protein
VSATRGTTLGIQWLRPVGSGDLRLHAEATSLERGSDARQRPLPGYYLGRATEQGLTQRGQVIGASIGPGGSSQWLAGDYLRGSSAVGLYVGRIRWENDVFYDQDLITWHDHDVTLFGGMRLAGTLLGSRWTADTSVGRRFNYLFQRALNHPTRPREAVDVNNVTVRVTVEPFAVR